MIQLRDVQRRAIDEGIYAYFQQHQGNPVLALPTAFGKSIVIAQFIREVLQQWPGQRILMLTHVKELVQQNYNKIRTIAPDLPVGVYSAGLNRRDTKENVIFASVQSVANKAHVLGWFDLVMIDECHMVPTSSNTRYRVLIAALQKYNPALKVIGLSATPYRKKGGYLTEGDDRIFTDISIDLTQGDELVALIDAGYLSPLRPKEMDNKVSTEGVKISGGDFTASSLEKALQAQNIIDEALEEAIEYGKGRRAWMFFFPGVATAVDAAERLRARGISAICVHGGMGNKARDKAIEDIRAGKYQAITNCDILTTGFDYPEVDLIALFRATRSPNLYVQILGRGMRVADGKKDCLVLDYAGNTARHGPINNIRIPKKGRKGMGGGAPVKTCPKCAEIVPASAGECAGCGYEFPKVQKDMTPTASTEKLIARREDRIQNIEVVRVLYSKHEARSGKVSLKVAYDTGIKHIYEWVHLGQPGRLGNRAIYWWMERSKQSSFSPPATVDEALERVVDELRRPGRIIVDSNGKYPEVTAHDFEATTVDPPGEVLHGSSAGGLRIGLVANLSDMRLS